MKRLTLLLIALVLSAFAFTACTAPEITGAKVNDKGELVLTYSDGTTATLSDVDGLEQNSLGNATLAFDEYKNLILTYPDGTTVSLGKNAIAEYAVRFVDHDGSLIAEEKVLAGLGANAPTAPMREDYVFAGWDKSFASVTQDMTVTATYTAMESYTVTFVDYDGAVLKTETVVSGKDATPPADPTRTDYNFTGWQGSYTGVTGDVTVTATYVQKGMCTVTFMDYNGLTLGTATVKEGGSATAPVTPTRDGYTFKGWSSSLSNITANKTVTAQYTLVSAVNVFDIAYKVSGNTVTLTLSLAGDICLVGFEGTLSFEGMTATEIAGNSANVLANLKQDGTVSIAYTSATNVTRGETVLTVTLTKTADAGTATLALADCFKSETGSDGKPVMTAVPYTVIGESLKLK